MQHNVEVFGSHVTTDDTPPGRLCLASLARSKYYCKATPVSIFWLNDVSRISRNDNDQSLTRDSGLQVCLSINLFEKISHKFNFLLNLLNPGIQPNRVREKEFDANILLCSGSHGRQKTSIFMGGKYFKQPIINLHCFSPQKVLTNKLSAGV